MDSSESDTPQITPVQVDGGQLERLVNGTHHDPHRVLGPHLSSGAVTLRVLRPFARTVSALFDDQRVELRHEHEGVWVGVLNVDKVPDYRLEVAYSDGPALEVDDPYRYLPSLGEVDLHLIGEGRHEQLWTMLGAHVRRYDGPTGSVTGTSFAVWAPNAQGIRLTADFNFWDGRAHPMRMMGSTGVWELFVPGVGPGTRYKFDICGRDGIWRQKADPLANLAETPPANASVVYESSYDWKDADWLAHRSSAQAYAEPMSVYEVHLGSWRKGRSYRDLATELVDYVTELGFTHVELMPVMEHPFGGSWGYQVTSYFAPTSRFGEPDDFRFLVDSLHQANIGVIVDWVPAHFPKDAWALARFDGTPLYEHPDPRRGEQPDWGTLVFDFGRPQVRNFLVATGRISRPSPSCRR
jgi:1,4-alpha-glucan branching enzyme